MAPETRFMQIGQLVANISDWLRIRSQP